MENEPSKVTRITENPVEMTHEKEPLKPVTVRFFPSEILKIKEAVKQEGTDRSAYIRAKVLGADMGKHVKVNRKPSRKLSPAKKQRKQDCVVAAYIYRSFELMWQELRKETNPGKRLGAALVLARMDEVITRLGTNVEPTETPSDERSVNNVR